MNAGRSIFDRLTHAPDFAAAIAVINTLDRYSLRLVALDRLLSHARDERTLPHRDLRRHGVISGIADGRDFASALQAAEIAVVARRCASSFALAAKGLGRYVGRDNT